MALHLDDNGYLNDLGDWDEDAAHQLAATGIHPAHGRALGADWTGSSILCGIRPRACDEATRQMGKTNSGVRKGKQHLPAQIIPCQSGQTTRARVRTSKTYQVFVTRA